MKRMKVGLLWFDDDPKRDMVQKIGRAAQHYTRKFGRSPDVCYVHPSLLKEPTRMGDLTVIPSLSIPRDHFWLGEEDDR